MVEYLCLPLLLLSVSCLAANLAPKNAKERNQDQEKEREFLGVSRSEISKRMLIRSSRMKHARRSKSNSCYKIISKIRTKSLISPVKLLT